MRSILNIKRALFLYFVTALAAGCARTAPVSTISKTEAPAPSATISGWPISTPEQEGMDSDVLADMLEEIQDQRHNIDSVVIIRNGSMVLEAYVYPWKPNTNHIIHSCTKSIVSILIGIAIDIGHIESVDQTVLSLFPQRIAANLDARKQSMNLEDLLTMSSGLDCQDSYLYRWRGLRQMQASEDWVQHMLDLPMVDEPGTRFEYCNGASFLLSAIVQETTGMSALDFAKEHLFGPLEITDLTWPGNPAGISIGWGELRMLPRDMAKIGQLYLRGGMWDDLQIVSTAWVEASTQKHISATLEDGYGYQWWIEDEGFYMALGYAGQFIFVVPEKNLVVVFTSDLAESDFYTPQNLLTGFILRAASRAAPLPENPDGQERLEERIQVLASP
jgi:CubicO group peptidase (beta-lactamase class C family)